MEGGRTVTAVQYSTTLRLPCSCTPLCEPSLGRQNADPVAHRSAPPHEATMHREAAWRSPRRRRRRIAHTSRHSWRAPRMHVGARIDTQSRSPPDHLRAHPRQLHPHTRDHDFAFAASVHKSSLRRPPSALSLRAHCAPIPQLNHPCAKFTPARPAPSTPISHDTSRSGARTPRQRQRVAAALCQTRIGGGTLTRRPRTRRTPTSARRTPP